MANAEKKKKGPESHNINGKEIIYWREANHITRSNLAKDLDSTAQTIKEWELGRREMSQKMVDHWESVLGFNPITEFGLAVKDQDQQNNGYSVFIDGKHLEGWRKYKGVTINQIAEVCEVDKSTISEWINEETQITYNQRMLFKAKWGFDPGSGFKHNHEPHWKVFNNEVGPPKPKVE